MITWQNLDRLESFKKLQSLKNLVSIKDEGPGISREDQKYVFDRFYTSSGAANPQGTGLGLFIANQIAQRHNADICMENRCESGCRITVVFWKYRPGNNTM